MRVELRVPAAGESITEAQVADWLKHAGDRIRQDEPLVVLETDKAAMELPSPVSGVLAEILKGSGETVKVGDVLAYLEDAPSPEAAGTPAAATPSGVSAGTADAETPAAAPVKPAAPTPAADRDVEAEEAPSRQPKERKPDRPVIAPAAAQRSEEAVPMSLLRRRVAERLVHAQQTAALLTTFNEIDMSAVMALRRAHEDTFREQHNVKLGFMSFFVKATISALKQVPELNAEIRGTDIVHRHYYDIGVAVGGGRGLVVPVIRNAERLSFAELESAIADFASRARDNRLTVEELQGGTFTLSNGGVYGSLLSTPIVNPPQSGILGLHAIQERPVARDGQVVIRPMMYVALTYDHRIVDGREAVTFLKRVKDSMEEPARLLLEI
jgi:2-oxoglutarate dehydrogenase E2 component (dihydrolipoamide succinyltransferase)